MSQWERWDNLSDQLLALLWCHSGATRNSGQKGKRCAFCVLVLCFKYQCLCSKKEHVFTVLVQRDLCNFYDCALYTKQRHISTLSLSPLLCLQSLCRFFFFPKVVHFINVYLSAVLHCQPCSETATTNKKLLCCRGLCIECFEKLEREEERDAPSTVQSQVLHVKHYKYEAEQNSLRMKRFWFSTHGSHHVSFRVINGH